MPQRFIEKELSPGAWTVVDTESARWNMAERAITMNVRHDAAVRIAVVLNEEWLDFQRHPS